MTDPTLPAAALPARPARPPADPLLIAGVALLLLLTLGVALLFRGAPQSVAEVGSAARVALAPDAFTPRVSRARERVDAALRARASGDTAGAIARYAEAEEEALTARARAAGAEQAALATELWAGILLDRAELMLSTGSRPWYRADDAQVLREALAAVQRARTVTLPPALTARAEGLEARIRQRLRPGPLELLPR